MQGFAYRSWGRLKMGAMLLASASVTLPFAADTNAATYTWDGGGTDANWGTANNWDPDGTPTFDNTADVVFYSAGAARLSNFLGDDRIVRSLTFNDNADSAVTIRLTTTASVNTGRRLDFDADSGDATITVDAGSTGNHTIGIANTGGQIVLIDNLVIDHNGSGTLTFGRRLNQGGSTSSVTKNGTGTIIFANDTSSTNNYSGFIMNAGTVENNSALGFGNSSAASPITFNGGTIRNNVTVTNTNAVNVTVEATANVKTWQHSSGTAATFSGNFTLNETDAGDFQIDVTGAGNLLLDGVISGDGGIEKTGAGAGFLRLGQFGANTYTGTTKVTAGELRLNNLGAIQDSGLDTAGSGFITANAGTGNYVIGGLISGRDLSSVFTEDAIVGSPARVTTLTLNPLSGTVTYNNVIGDLSTGMSLTKTGAGTQVLGGANTYSGSTSVTAGTLEIASAGSIASPTGISIGAGGRLLYNSSTALTVAPSLGGAGTGSRAILAGTGTINSALTLDNLGDVLSPGNSPGILPFGTSQSWDSFTYEWEINDWTGTTAGTAFDQIAITGSLDLSSGTAYELDLLSLDAGNTSGQVPNFAETARSWTILTTTGGITGFDSNLWTIDPSGFSSSPTATGSWSLATGNGGQDLVLSYVPVPEPATLGLFGLVGLLAAAGVARRARAVSPGCP